MAGERYRACSQDSGRVGLGLKDNTLKSVATKHLLSLVPYYAYYAEGFLGSCD